MANFYVDDSGLIYAEQSSSDNTGAGITDINTLGLADAPGTSTMSTWLINSIRFHVQGYIDPSGPAVQDGQFRILCGILPKDYTPYPNSLDDFQEVKGWPLKNGFKQVFVENTPQANHFSWTFTYKPRDHLALNRLQEIACSINAVNGDWYSHTSIYVCASRGN